MKRALPIIISSILSAVAVVWVYDRYFNHFKPQNNPDSNHPTTEEKRSSPPIKWGTKTLRSYAPTDFTQAAARCTPSVVYIESKHRIRTYPWMQEQYGMATGSGVIISPDGYIATNNHVVKDAVEYTVQLNNRKRYRAELIGTDPTTDLALLRIQADSLPAIEFGNSDSLKIGEWVLAVGNPFSLQSTVTAGIVSAKGRNIDILRDQQFRIESFIQTDAVVNPGNSGGALVNTAGQLVGINSAILSHTGQYEGYSFAIPANLASKILRDLRDYGSVQRGLLGVSIVEVSEALAKERSLPDLQGIFIAQVVPGSGADDAGLLAGDVLLSINGIPVNDVPKMQEIVGQKHPGDTIQVVFRREGERQNADVVLKNVKNNTEIISFRKDKMLRDIGIHVRDLYSEEGNTIGQNNGAKVLTIFMGSPIDQQTDMVPGFVITGINGHPVRNANDVAKFIKEAGKKITFVGRYENHHRPFTYTVYR